MKTQEKHQGAHIDDENGQSSNQAEQPKNLQGYSKFKFAVVALIGIAICYTGYSLLSDPAKPNVQETEM